MPGTSERRASSSLDRVHALVHRALAPFYVPRAERGAFALVVGVGALVPLSVGLVRQVQRPHWLWPGPPVDLGASALAFVTCLAAMRLAFVASDRVERLRIPRSLRTALGVAVAATLPLLLLGYSVARPFADLTRGDGRAWVRMANLPVLWTSEPLGRGMHYFAYRFLDRGLRIQDGLIAVRLASWAAGLALALVVAARIASALPRADRVATTALLVVTPTWVLFSGYAETTPWAYALLATYSLLGIAYLGSTSDRAPFLASGVLALALATHGSICFATGAHLVLLEAYRRRSAGRSRVGRAMAILVCAIGPFLLLAAGFAWAYSHPPEPIVGEWYSNAMGGGDSEAFVSSPFAPTPPWTGWSYGYVAFEPLHRNDLANLVLGACPLFLLLPWSVKRASSRDRWSAGFLTSAVVGLCLLTVAWNADWGMHRDVDLFALFAVPTTWLTVVAWTGLASERTQRLAANVVVPVVWAFVILPQLTAAVG